MCRVPRSDFTRGCFLAYDAARTPEGLLYCTYLRYVTRTLDPYLVPPNSPELLQPSDLRLKRPRAATRCSST